MNLQTHNSGQVSGQVLKQARTPPGLTQQNHNPMPGQIQYPSMHDPHQILDFERQIVQKHILQMIMQKRSPQEGPNKQKIMDMVRRLDTNLLRMASSKEDYLNLATLASRLQFVVRRTHNQQFQCSNSSPSIGTMIPTPGLQQAGNLPLDSRIATNHSSNAIAPSSFNSGSFSPNGGRTSGSLGGCALSSPHGALPTGYQQSSAFAVNYGGNYMASPIGVPEMTSKMIPTPGFNHSDDINNNSKNPSLVKLEPANNVTAFPAVESPYPQQSTRKKQNPSFVKLEPVNNVSAFSALESPYPQQSTRKKQNVGSQNGCSLQNPIVPVSGGTISTLGDRYGISGVDASGSQDLYVHATSAGSLSNNQSSSAAPIQSTIKTHGLVTGQSTMNCTQWVVKDEPQSIDESEHYSARKNYVQDNQPQSFQQPSPGSQREVHPQPLSGSFSQSQLSSNIVSEPKSEPGTENCVVGLQSQVSNRFQFSEMQSQFQKKSMERHSKSTRLHTPSSGPTEFLSPLAQISNSSQSHQSTGSAQANDAFCGQGHSRSQDASHASDSGHHLHDQVQGESYNSLAARGVELKKSSSEESILGQSDFSAPAECPSTSDSVFQSNNPSPDCQLIKKVKWMLFLMHARQCESRQSNCSQRDCPGAQKLLKHIEHCKNAQCSYLCCSSSRSLISHYRKCQNESCDFCSRIKQQVQSYRQGILARSKSCGDVEISGGPRHTMSPVLAETPEDLQPPIKRIKIEHGSQLIVPKNESSIAVPSAVVVSSSQDGQHVQLLSECHMPMKSEVSVKLEVPSSCQLTLKAVKMENRNLDGAYVQKTDGESVALSNLPASNVQEINKIEKAVVQAKPENLTVASENASKPGKPKITGVSMTELFTPEQIRQHITGLRQWVGQSKAKAERNQAMERTMNANSCQLCAVEKLAFEPPPLYCTPCGARIRRSAVYYTVGGGETRYYFCLACYNEARGDTMVVIGKAIPKARMEKKRNDEETEEWWVQCDKCEFWQHQICALFNGRRNEGGQAEYTCPNCYIEEVERGERDPLPQSAVLGAKDLPKTILSDHLEERLFAKLKQERQDRARVQGKCYDEVLGAESLVVRVVSSVDKKLEVKPRFLEIFQEENYPVDFPYKSKVVLLFQNIEGVEVCLFGMYVQEFGSDCQEPNHRRVYLSYLDSVKYFRPEVKTVTGEALRTFVYHEILIGYLEYCKQRGFTSCYIWACPPLKGEDYILYCHPEIQKTPKSDKLREWYLSMLRKAAKENIVVELTNLYEHFFVPTGERKAKVTASRLPYFDGDYWPGAAEDMLTQLQQEEDGRKQNKKGPMKKTITKRSLQALGHIDISTNAAKDLMLMRKLGETISPMKEDFIMVHLQHSCTHCCILMVSGSRWVCKQCTNFQLCDRCYDAEQKCEERESHPINQKEKHSFYPVVIEGIPEDTKDKDDILESEFFDTRQAFLSLCQGNHYQYDTLRRAKHSSMMVLYHLHNPTAPAFVATCNVCSHDIESGQGWRCETCTDYDVCNNCYQKDGGINHPHKLTYSPSNVDAQNTEARDKRVMQLKEMLKLLVHASQCRSPQCQFDNCRKVKGLFRHGMICKTRVTGGCLLCKKMWYLLQLHSRSCKQPECTVPRCRDLREHVKRVQQQADSRRRAAVNEMMRNRALEVSGNL